MLVKERVHVHNKGILRPRSTERRCAEVGSVAVSVGDLALVEDETTGPRRTLAVVCRDVGIGGVGRNVALVEEGLAIAPDYNHCQYEHKESERRITY
jgi:predicted metal-dependent enzyme (double-stranded beta helix superfamily)